MLKFLKRLFGEGTIYTEFICTDGSVGRAKAPYIGDPDTFDEQEYLVKLQADVWHQYQKRVQKITKVTLS